MGKLACGWLNIYVELKVNTSREKKTKQVDDYIWGGAIVKTLLTHSIKVWEMRNKELHGETGCSKVWKQQLELEVQELQLLKDKA